MYGYDYYSTDIKIINIKERYKPIRRKRQNSSRILQRFCMTMSQEGGGRVGGGGGRERRGILFARGRESSVTAVVAGDRGLGVLLLLVVVVVIVVVAGGWGRGGEGEGGGEGGEKGEEEEGDH